MALDVVDLRAFYAAPLGRIAHRFLSGVIRHWWRDTTGLSVLGCGFALPYLDLFRDEALRNLAFMPAEQGVVHWPHSGQPISSSALIEPDLLPLPDGSIDRVLLIHMLEVTDYPRDLLEEVWRVLAPSGRLIVVAPNRRGWWARVDTTPFGYGQPFSRGQLGRLLRDSLFSPERFGEILYIPPFERNVTLRMAPLFERVGGRLALPGAGLLMAEATKQLYRPVMVRRTVRRSLPRLHPALAPVALPQA
jgi:SAM-dependent methyltransferase